jgi:histidine triad (HIT) family protein
LLTDTIFAKIIRGELPSFKVYEDDDFLVILDKFPAHMGHCLILPKTPAKDIFDLDEQTAAKLYPLAKRVAGAVKKAAKCDGINILQNNGADAGQVVFYFHLHVMPRFKGDGFMRHGSVQKEYQDEQFADMAADIKKDLSL